MIGSSRRRRAVATRAASAIVWRSAGFGCSARSAAAFPFAVVYIPFVLHVFFYLFHSFIVCLCLCVHLSVFFAVFSRPFSSLLCTATSSHPIPRCLARVLPLLATRHLRLLAGISCGRCRNSLWACSRLERGFHGFCVQVCGRPGAGRFQRLICKQRVSL